MLCASEDGRESNPVNEHGNHDNIPPYSRILVCRALTVEAYAPNC